MKLGEITCSDVASDALTAKLTVSEKSFEIVPAEVASLKEKVSRANAEKLDSDKVVAEVRKESEHLLVRLNVALVGHNLAERLTGSRVTESANAFDAVVQQLGYDSVSRLRQGLEIAYLAVRMPCQVAFTRA